jgi:hypothetical protein
MGFQRFEESGFIFFSGSLWTSIPIWEDYGNGVPSAKGVPKKIPWDFSAKGEVVGNPSS